MFVNSYKGISLTSITIPNGVTSLGAHCFDRCTKITYIQFSSSLQKVGNNVFSGAMQEKTIVCPALTPPNYDGTGNYFIDSNASLFVQNNAVDKYNNVAPWNTAKSIQTIFSLPAEVTVAKTDTIKLEPVLNVAEYHYEGLRWTSSNTEVASVNETTGVVIANKAGDAAITATTTDGAGVSISTMVHVTPLMATDVELITTSAVKFIPTKLETKVLPVEADNKELTWISLTPAIAFITEDGTIIGWETGTAQVQTTTIDGSNISKTFNVEITQLPVSGISLPKEVSIVKTDTLKLKYTVSPVEADNQQLKWSSSDTNVASVDETTGIVTANKVGDAVITATATDESGISASTTVHVTPLPVSGISIPKEVSILKTDTLKLEYTVSPVAADNQQLKWTSSDAAVASVDETTGLITANEVGDAVITATATDGSGVSASCNVTVQPEKVLVESLYFEESEMMLDLEKGKTMKLSVHCIPENATNKHFKWVSKNPEIATVDDDGNVTGVSRGDAVITVASTDGSNKSAYCVVFVYVNLASVRLDKQSIELYEGETAKLNVTVTPADATDPTVTWSSSNPNVVTVDDDGNIRAVSAGLAGIAAVSNDEGHSSAACSVKVKACLTGLSFESDTYEFVLGRGCSSIYPICTPSNASDVTFRWTSSNEHVATVDSLRSFVNVNSIAPGETVITATSTDGQNISASFVAKVIRLLEGIAITPYQSQLHVGESVELKCTFTPEDASNKTLVWSSDNESVATVDQDGKVTARAPGYAQLTARSSDGSGVSAWSYVTVSEPSGINDITIGSVHLCLKGRHLTIAGLADDEQVYIDNTAGCTIYRGIDHEIDLPCGGVYIIKVKGQTMKLSVK